MTTLATSRILVLDDDPGTCRFMQELLARPEREIETSLDPEQALSRVRVRPFDLVISDLKLNARLDGIDVLRSVREMTPGTPVIIVTGFGELEKAVEAVREGAFDFVSKPFNITELKGLVERALQKTPAAAPQAAVRDNMPPALLGRTPVMTGVYKQIAHAASADAPVLIIGESGTGKELVARAIHQHSNRASRPFVPINCGALTETLLESELFGHTKGSFTGAVNDTKGVFQTGHTGTVFLDEVGEMSPGLQVKLLRVLQEGEVRPVGSSRAVRTDVRILAATNVDVDRAVAEGKFRQDLFYRLGVVVITLPPLRDRREDIPLLIERFLKGACAKAGKRVELTPAAVESLSSYPWPGNVRELENMIERLVVFSRGSRIDAGDLPPTVTPRAPALEKRLFDDLPLLEELERRYLLHVLEQVGNNRTRAAEVMGIDRRTLYRMAERFGIPLAEQPD
ncbi:MAG TPA: sigma-54 dependent transcriptional regulator [Vicinamibacterales bacterium]|nr:sigma-54 dependent transcriptional regulator [Vicinamibacterales bacterium]